MANLELHRLTIEELGPLLRNKTVSPTEVTGHFLERIATLGEHTNAYITVMAEAAMAEARAREAEILAGEYRGPLHGIPVALKDLYDTAGVRTTAASKIFADRVPEQDATTVRLLREAGAIIIGKTNLHEWAFGVTNERSYFGPTRNPWDLDRITGGSSGGSGAAVAADLCVAATGSDTGGSIRIPSALCGTVGLKPTFGRISCTGLVPLAWSLDHPGPMTKSVYDAAVMLGVMAGWDPKDPATLNAPVPDYRATLRSGVQGLRIAVDPDCAFSEVDEDVGAAVKQAVTVLEGLGAEVVEVALPRIDEARDAALTILISDAAAYHEQFLTTRPEDYEPGGARTRLEPARSIRAVDYARAERTRQWIQRDFASLFEQVDLFATPTTAIPAPRLGQADTAISGGIISVLAGLTRFTRLFNLVGSPAISVPCGFSRDGLPIGLQLIGAHLREAIVLRAAYAYESATDWHRRSPSL
ncbi:MAG: amidase [Ardenticatenaceae bacterium]|nr:amidase [Ardenticatenaceae bacterium]HBY99158.1 Asp-tRNA(Asn)/Glu-tRNA(Gln) amidotransferase GatCAB subunit A [Chloroflexota bacterium]